MIVASLRLLARHARWCLAAGLAIGIAAPELAALIRPLIPFIVALMLFTAVFRVEPAAARFRREDALADGITIAAFQIVLPLGLYAGAVAAGAAGPTFAAIIVVLMAPSITASPGLSQLLGLDGARALRLLIFGTLALPATAAIVFAFLPRLVGDVDLIGAVFRLLALIVAATVCGTLARRAVEHRRVRLDLVAVDGGTALLLALFVIGLMEAIRPALLAEPGRAAAVLGLAVLVNLGLQALGALAAGLARADPSWLEAALVAGNRNGALFLAALPISVTDPWLLFIGCYQIPMLLTPLIMAPLYRWSVAQGRYRS